MRIANIFTPARMVVGTTAIGLHFLLFSFFIHEKVVRKQATTAARSIVVVFPIKKRALLPPAIKQPYLRKQQQQTAKPQPDKLLAAKENPLPSLAIPPVPEMPQPGAYEILAQARKDIARIDKEMRAESGTLSLQEERTLESRLGKGFAAAYVGRGQTITAFYESPDGTVYTKITRGGVVRCTMNARAANISSALKSGGPDPVRVNCPPAHYAWKSSPG